jgi:hypothetical protein
MNQGVRGWLKYCKGFENELVLGNSDSKPHYARLCFWVDLTLVFFLGEPKAETLPTWPHVFRFLFLVGQHQLQQFAELAIHGEVVGSRHGGKELRIHTTSIVV